MRMSTDEQQLMDLMALLEQAEAFDARIRGLRAVSPEVDEAHARLSKRFGTHSRAVDALGDEVSKRAIELREWRDILGGVSRALSSAQLHLASLPREDPDPDPDPGTDPPTGGWLPVNYQYAEPHLADPLLHAAPIVVRASEHEDSIPRALQAAWDELKTIDPRHRERRGVVVLLGERVYPRFAIADGSTSSPDYVDGGIFDAAFVALVGPNPVVYFDGGHEWRPNVAPFAKIVPPQDRYGDTIRIGPGKRGDRPRFRADFRLIGIERQVEGRANLHINTGNGVQLTEFRCRHTVRPGGATVDKWNGQLYHVSPRILECTIDMPSVEEHGKYVHGHCDGVPMHFWRVHLIGCGGQPLQLTERSSTVMDAGADACIIEQCVFTGFHQFAGRAGSALTIAGAGLRVKLKQTVIVDDDPTDTRGQSPNHANTSYGALVATTYEDPGQSYAHVNDGYGNESLEIEDCILAIRRGNRPLAQFSGTRSVDIQTTAFLAAESNRRSIVNPLDREVQCGSFGYDGSGRPSEKTREAFSSVVSNARRADYARMGFDVRKSSAGQRLIGPDEIAHVVGDVALVGLER